MMVVLRADALVCPRTRLRNTSPCHDSGIGAIGASWVPGQTRGPSGCFVKPSSVASAKPGPLRQQSGSRRGLRLQAWRYPKPGPPPGHRDHASVFTKTRTRVLGFEAGEVGDEWMDWSWGKLVECETLTVGHLGHLAGDGSRRLQTCSTRFWTLATWPLKMAPQGPP